ncbi:MAG: type II toxin-antitoxin system RelE/ParE family toxin [Cellvibrio sp.]|nr:type II toxin-antitoxin system RelE/ParE family toxin [Cellvibrio sp.]
MDIIFSSFALQELLDAEEYYNFELAGLGNRFNEEIKKAVLRIAEYPDAWSIERDNIRKCLLQKFPYKILYAIEKDCILILAIAHLHRKPDYWIDQT